MQSAVMWLDFIAPDWLKVFPCEMCKRLMFWHVEMHHAWVITSVSMLCIYYSDSTELLPISYHTHAHMLIELKHHFLSFPSNLQLVHLMHSPFPGQEWPGNEANAHLSWGKPMFGVNNSQPYEITTYMFVLLHTSAVRLRLSTHSGV